MKQAWRERLARVLVRALSPVLGLIIRFRLPWTLRRRLLYLSPKSWLALHNRLDKPPAPPERVGAVLDARSAAPDTLARALDALRQGHGEALAVHVVGPGGGCPAQAHALWATPPRCWEPEALGQALLAASNEAELCLCAALDERVEATLHPIALAHLASALTSQPEALFAYCDEEVLRGRNPGVFCKPAWDPVLFETLQYLGPFVLARSALLARAATEECAGTVIEAVAQAAAGMRKGSVVHLPLPLVRTSVQPGRAHPLPRAARDVPAEPPASSPLVSVILPTKDRADLLSACLRTLRRTVAEPARLELILVDNGSTCPAALALLEAEERQGATVLRDAGGFNFSRLVNLGARAARGELLLLLNNDVEFRQPGWLELMLRHALRPGVGCVGATLSYRNGIVQHAGVVLGMYSPMLGEHVAGHLHHGWEADGGGHFGLLRHARTVSAVTAALLLVRADVFHAAGGFEEALAVALNDVDFCLKVRRLGLENVVVPATGIIHLESATRNLDRTRGKVERLRAENAVLRAAWGQALAEDAFYSPNLGLDLSYCLSPHPRPRTPRARPVGCFQGVA